MRTADSIASYRCYDSSEHIEGTKEQIQSFGIGLGLAFPGEPNGPKRQLSVRDPRGFEVKITKSYWPRDTFAANISYPNLPKRPRKNEIMAFPGVRKREAEYGGCDEFRGRPEDLVAAGLVLATQLPGSPGMRKTCVTILADGTVLTGYHSNAIPGAVSAGAKRVERASPNSATVVVRIHVDQAERDRRDSLREIANSAWLHEVRKIPKPRKLVPSFGTAVVKHSSAAAAAKHDSLFQEMLGRLVRLPQGEGS
jgi:hypothetical protein